MDVGGYCGEGVCKGGVEIYGAALERLVRDGYGGEAN